MRNKFPTTLCKELLKNKIYKKRHVETSNKKVHLTTLKFLYIQKKSRTSI